MGMFRDLCVNGRFICSFNSTFLVLIPRRGGAEDRRDFKPISLFGSLYNLLVKVLANRLREVLIKMVSPTHDAFFKVVKSFIRHS